MSAPRPARRLAFAAVLLLAAAAGVWWTLRLMRPSSGPRIRKEPATACSVACGASRAPAAREPGEPESSELAEERAIPAGAATGQTRRLETTPPSARHDGPTDPELDWAQTSWQNPFSAAHWHSAGWTFEEDAMRSTIPEAEAAFGRRYERLMLEVRILPLEGRPAEFTVRLEATATRTLLDADFSERGVVVSEERDGRRSVVRQRDVSLLSAERPAHLLLTASGNRLRIAGNGRMLLTCDQPASQSGVPLRLVLRARAGAVRINELRLEGE